MNSSKKSKALIYFFVVLEIIALGYVVFCIFNKQSNVGLFSSDKFFTTIDMVGMVLIILFSLAALNHYIRNQRFFFVMTIAIFFGMGFDAMDILFAEISKPTVLLYNNIAASGMLVCSSVLVFSLYFFMMDTIVNKNAFIKKVSICVVVGFIISVGLRIGNFWGRYYAYIDDDGIYQEGRFYLFIFFYIIFVFMVIFAFVIVSKISLKAKITTILMFVIPFIEEVFCEAYFDVSCFYSLLSICSIVFYSVFFMEQRYYDYQRLKIFDNFLPQREADYMLSSSNKDLENGKRMSVAVVELVICSYHENAKGKDAGDKVALFNFAMERFVPIAENNGGIVLEYNHDGVGFVFGAPNGEPMYCDRAIKTAIEISKAIPGINNELRALKFPEIHVSMAVVKGITMLAGLKINEQIYYTSVSSLSENCRKIAKRIKPDIIVTTKETIENLSKPVKTEYSEKFVSEEIMYQIDLYKVIP